MRIVYLRPKIYNSRLNIPVYYLPKFGSIFLTQSLIESLTYWSADEFNKKIKNSVIIHPKKFPNYPIEVFDFKELEGASHQNAIEFCDWANDIMIKKLNLGNFYDVKMK